MLVNFSCAQQDHKLNQIGKTPIDWRASFVFGKKAARKSLSIIKAWQADNIIIAHGECIWGDGRAFLERSFKWLE